MAKIITYHGSMDTLVWLKERSGMDSDTEVVVPVAYEAIFVRDGRMVGSLTMGRYNLSECAVGEGRLFATAGELVDCRIYYVKKEGAYNIKFATSKPLCIVDPVLKINVEIDLKGEFAIKIIESKKFLSKLLAFTQKVSLDEVKGFFRDRMMIYIKDQLVIAMAENGISSIELSRSLMPLSKDLELRMRYVFENYGVSVEGFMLKKAELLSGGACQNDESNAQKPAKSTRCKKEQPAAGAEAAPAIENTAKGEIMYCPKCGIDLPPLSKYCYQCGLKIE